MDFNEIFSYVALTIVLLETVIPFYLFMRMVERDSNRVLKEVQITKGLKTKSN